jgi:hypothetical protein
MLRHLNYIDEATTSSEVTRTSPNRMPNLEIGHIESRRIHLLWLVSIHVEEINE